MATHAPVLPDLVPDRRPDAGGPSTGGRWMLVIHNNDVTSVDEVVDALLRATGCDLAEAQIETWEAHTYGQAPVHFASREECLAAAPVLEAVGVRTEVAPEWDD